MKQNTHLSMYRSDLMVITKVLKLVRFLVPVLIATLVASCSASQHAGVSSIKEPPLTEDNESIWFQYYQDQFEAKDGKVEPPAVQYPQSAVHAYQQEKTVWDKTMETKNKTLVFAGIAMVGAIVLILYIIPPFHISTGLNQVD